CKVSQADETPVIVSKDGRATGSKSYMWVYRTGKMYNAPPIILYDYQRTRNSSHPKDFLKKYQGVLVTDGYQVYHQLEKEESGITIAGCWSHARRRYADVVKTMDKEAAKSTLAYAALRQIAMIYKIDNDLIELTPEDRVVQRQLLVKPQVEAFFAWIKNHKQEVASQSETAKANNLKPYEYFKYLLKEIPQHMDDKDLTFLDKLLPWSDQLPEQCRKQTKQ
ncbi:hypothetical protein Cpap_2869, partial [Ruminiclostridium papyrosolvens DSM 2782]